jgi:hypothetical protein
VNNKFKLIILSLIAILLNFNHIANAEITFYLSDEDHDSDTNGVTYYRRIVGTPNNEILNLYNDNWDYKVITYELYYDDRKNLADDIYSLAIFTKDITADVSLDRFEKGVQGFHYDINQVCDWINSRKDILVTPLERQFFFYLLIDDIVKYVDNVATPTGKVKHVLGIAPGSRRSMESAVQHERIHVIWDEDIVLRSEYSNKWKNLTANEKSEVVNNLKGYSSENENQLIEEWAVRLIEHNEDNKR